MGTPQVLFPPGSVGTSVSVGSSITDVVLLVAATAGTLRTGVVIVNRSNSRLYIRTEAAVIVPGVPVPEPPLVYSERIQANGRLVIEGNYQGIIHALWAPNVSGFALVTVYTA